MTPSFAQYIELAVLRMIFNDDEKQMSNIWKSTLNKITVSPIELYLKDFDYHPSHIQLLVSKLLNFGGTKNRWVPKMVNSLIVSGKFTKIFTKKELKVDITDLVQVFNQIKIALDPFITIGFAEGSDQLIACFKSVTIMELVGKFSGLNVGKKNKTNYKKQTPSAYYADEYGPDNWFRKITVDPDDIRRYTGGAVIMMTPVHLLPGNPVCLNPNKKESERTYIVKNSPKPYRKFDGTSKKHCSGCPFEEGCVMCTLV